MGKRQHARLAGTKTAVEVISKTPSLSTWNRPLDATSAGVALSRLRIAPQSVLLKVG